MDEKDKTIQFLREQLQKQGQEKDEVIRELRALIANLQETIEELRRMVFGTSSEKTGRRSSGDPTEREITPGEDEEIHVQGYTRTKKAKSIRKDLYESLPLKRIDIPVPDEDRNCPDCDTPMEHLGYKYVREELRITPAKVERVHYYQETLVCPVCREEDDTTIVGAKTPTQLLKHSPASASAVAYVMYEKSGLHLPFYRQENDWKQKGVPLARETIAKWYNQCALNYLLPVYDALHKAFLKRTVIHVDETPCQVLKEPERTAAQKSYFWIYLTGSDGKPMIVLYDYRPGRKASYAVEFLEGYQGYLHCDGYSAYGKVPNVILVCCLAHCRRKFYDAVPANRRKRLKLLDIHSEQKIPEPVPDIAERDNLTEAEKGVLFCNRLFFMEQLYQDLPSEERKSKREEKELPIWEEFWEWLETVDAAGGSKLEKAVNYAKNHKQSLMNYLLDGRCEISNNCAERRAKSYAMGRKAFLFHNTPEGARASAIVLSLIETAKANNLNSFQYLYTLLLFMPDHKDSPESIDQLLPWSDFIQGRCKGLMDTETYTPENPGELPI